MNDPNTPATPAPAPATTAPTAPSIPVEPYPPQNLNPTYTADWIAIEKANLAAGKITPDEAARRFDALGASAEQIAPDTRSDEVKQFDAAFPPAKPEDFIIRYHEPGQFAPPMTPEMQQFDTCARSWLAGAEFPASVGNSLISAITKTAQATKHMSAEALESYGLLQYARLERVYGAELQDKLSAAGRLVEMLETKQPGLKDLLRSKGLGDNAEIASLLIQQAERYWMRRTGR